MGLHPRTFGLVVAAGALCGSVASAQPNSNGVPPDQGVVADHPPQPTPSTEAEKPAPKLPWRGSFLAWEQSATGQTVGIGQSYLSADPEYEMTFSLVPVVTFYDDDVNRFLVSGNIGVFHEFTNSDTTTKRGETSLTDALLFDEYSRFLYQHDNVKTRVAVRLPALTFPSSKASADSGVILGLGGTLKLSQAFPLLTAGTGFLETGSVAVTSGYTHTFTSAIVPVNPALQRVRLDTNGQAVPGDQLEGTPFAEHQVPIAAVAGLGLTDRLTLTTGVGWRLLWKYPLTQAEICGVVTTGCTPAQEPASPQRFGVRTEFTVDLDLSLFDELDVDASYQNATLQIGPDGQRRNIFYSPDARVALGVMLHLDALYLRAAGENPAGSTPHGLGRIAARRTSHSVE